MEETQEEKKSVVPAWVLQHARTVFGITASIAVIILAIVAGIKGKKNGDAEGASRGCTA
eukprot:m.173814 g.173814  ORF g.173814 m.173814 type:complete len:59 (+) comp17878_c0_seq5:113-289(+)